MKISIATGLTPGILHTGKQTNEHHFIFLRIHHTNDDIFRSAAI